MLIAALSCRYQHERYTLAGPAVLSTCPSSRGPTVRPGHAAVTTAPRKPCRLPDTDERPAEQPLVAEMPPARQPAGAGRICIDAASGRVLVRAHNVGWIIGEAVFAAVAAGVLGELTAS